MNSPESMAEAVKAALFAGHKIEAIKLYREQTNLGLAEAKAAVEALEAELRQTTPGSFVKAAAKPGSCVLTLAVLALGGFALVRMYLELRR